MENLCYISLDAKAENRQTQYFASGNNTTSAPDAAYQFDGEGRRVRKLVGQTETIFVYNAGNQLIAEYSNQLSQQQQQSPQVSYLTSDHLGSPRIVTDGGGTVISRHDYRAFDDEISANTGGRTTAQKYGATDDIRQRYTGYERDTESGLDYAQARYYNSAHGRFTSVDPLTASATIKNPQTFNRYSYALNSPYKFTDPLGLAATPTECGADPCGGSLPPVFDGGNCAKRRGRCIPGGVSPFYGDFKISGPNGNELGAAILLPNALLNQLERDKELFYKLGSETGYEKGDAMNEIEGMRQSANKLSNFNYGDRLITTSETPEGLIITPPEVEFSEKADASAGINKGIEFGGGVESSATVKYYPGKAVEPYNISRRKLNKSYAASKRAFIYAWRNIEVRIQDSILDYKSATVTESFLGALYDQKVGNSLRGGLADGYRDAKK